MLLDGDANLSATRWHERGAGELPFAVRPVGANVGDAEHVVVDTAANEAPEDIAALARAADHVVVPTVPSPLELVVTLEALRDLVHPSVMVLLTRCPPAPQSDAIDARALLTRAGHRVLTTSVPNRKPYATAALDGVTVREVRDRAAAELWAAWPRIIREVTT